jgi:hypothetical protein
MLQFIQDPEDPLKDQLDVRKMVNALTIEDWANLVKAFDRWPFAPPVSLSLIFALYSYFRNRSLVTDVVHTTWN